MEELRRWARALRRAAEELSGVAAAAGDSLPCYSRRLSRRLRRLAHEIRTAMAAPSAAAALVEALQASQGLDLAEPYREAASAAAGLATALLEYVEGDRWNVPFLDDTAGLAEEYLTALGQAAAELDELLLALPHLSGGQAELILEFLIPLSPRLVRALARAWLEDK